MAESNQKGIEVEADDKHEDESLGRLCGAVEEEQAVKDPGARTRSMGRPRGSKGKGCGRRQLSGPGRGSRTKSPIRKKPLLDIDGYAHEHLRLAPVDEYLSVKTLHEGFEAYVRGRQTTSSATRELEAGSEKRFGRQFLSFVYNKMAVDPSWKGVNKHSHGGPQVYSSLRLVGTPGRRKAATAALARLEAGEILSTGPGMTELTPSNPEYYRALLPREVYSGPLTSNIPVPFPVKIIPEVVGKGRGVFPISYMPPHTFVAEYRGYLIKSTEGTLREALYSAEQLCPTMISILPEDLKLDGYRDEEDQRIPIIDNLGACLNHSAMAPNCKLVKLEVNGRIRCFIFTREHGVPVDVELVWNYGDKRRGLEGWLRKS